jgi:hypothetical protein
MGNDEKATQEAPAGSEKEQSASEFLASLKGVLDGEEEVKAEGPKPEDAEPAADTKPAAEEEEVKAEAAAKPADEELEDLTDEDIAKLDQKGKTRLGRKVAKAKEAQEKLARENAELKAKLLAKEAEAAKEPAKASGDVTAPDPIDDPEAWYRYMRDKEEREKTEKKKAYSDKFGATFFTLLKDMPDMEEIQQEFFRKDESGNYVHNTPYRGDPELDAEFRLNQAARAYYQRKATTPVKPKIPGKGESPTGTGPTITPKNTVVAKKMPTLDAETSKFVGLLKARGVSDKEIEEALA